MNIINISAENREKREQETYSMYVWVYWCMSHTIFFSHDIVQYV